MRTKKGKPILNLPFDFSSIPAKLSVYANYRELKVNGFAYFYLWLLGQNNALIYFQTQHRTFLPNTKYGVHRGAVSHLHIQISK
jgi:hypothetical protein